MACKCRVCGVNDVDNPGDICELCAIGQDPYAKTMVGGQPGGGVPQSPVFGQSAQSGSSAYVPRKGASRKVLLGGGSSLANQDPYGNDMTQQPQQSSTVQVYSAGQAPQVAPSVNMASAQQAAQPAGDQPLTTGITKNVMVDTQKKSILVKWVRAMFTGVPFTLENDITMFQVFPDYSGTALNALGNACDQVIVYGKLNNGAVCENNDVEVYGRRDSNNNVVAKLIKNKATGTTVRPRHALGAGAVWIITVVVIALVAGIVSNIGVTGIVWAAVLLLCLTNLPLVFKIAGAVFGVFFSALKRIFK